MSTQVAPIVIDRPTAEARRVMRAPRLTSWELAAIVAGVAAAAVAVALTLRADFLAYPGWLAVQKADLILGPIGVGLYWRRRRPRSAFGAMLIAFGFVHVPYIAQSSVNSRLFTLGVHWEGVIYLATLAVILAFPTGRLRTIDRAILVVGFVWAVVPSSSISLFSPQISAGGSISACASACPSNAWLISSEPSVVERLIDIDRWAIIAVALGTSALLLWRIAVGTAPQRRALAIGTPIALVFLLTQAAYQLTFVFGHGDLQANTYARWIFVGARSALWYGFLLALVAAELFAGRVLRTMVRESLQRPSLRTLAELLRGPLDDPRLQLAFWDRRQRRWTDGEGHAVEAPPQGSQRMLTAVEHDSAPAVAIVHDVQLADDPELVRAAAETAMLAYENAQLQAGWTSTLSELKDSRARIAAASARERRSLEQDLHDGAQESLVALRMKLALASQDFDDAKLQRWLRELGDDLDDAIDELRDIAQGIYPSLLAELGLVPALRAIAQRATRSVEVTGEDVGRYSPEVESALYYCCREALQNAVRHAGPGAHVAIRLRDDGGELSFEVRDDGRGFEIPANLDGGGLRNLQDRLGALDGRITFASAPGRGAVISGAVPLDAGDAR